MSLMTQPIPPILLQDNHLLAFHKPAGLATSPPANAVEITLANLAQKYLKATYQKPGNVYLGVVHRLDRPTSGVVLFTRTSKAAARLSGQFHEKEIAKVYLACFEERKNRLPDQGEMLDWMRSEGAAQGQGVRHAERLRQGGPGAKEARLDYTLVARVPGLALALVRPKTGRTHQIRAQFAWRGCPLLGDDRYGAAGPLQGPTGAVIGLHAWGMRFQHPTLIEPVSLLVKPDASWPEALGTGPWLAEALEQLDNPWQEA